MLERILTQETYNVGANIGFMSINAGKVVGDNGRVTAIEPDPGVLTKLHHNVEINCATNVAIVPRAVGEYTGTTIFSVTTEEGLSRLNHGR